uniref:SWIM-type domain-containing protein n=1 Tax=Ditylenchus dipsaci TaxID=166011 RepID=A0A915D851_9BILA
MKKKLKNYIDCSKQDLPSPKQINDFLRHEAIRAGQLIQMKLSDLKSYAIQNSTPPENQDTAYVVAFKVSEDRKQWILVWTTKRLTDSQSKQGRVNHLQVDATYKLLYQGFPYFPVGFSDANKKFFCTFTALCSGETIWCYAGILRAVSQVCSTSRQQYVPDFVMSDADTAIESAVRRYLPKAKIFEKQRRKIKEDFRIVCAAQNTEECDEASTALINHWMTEYASVQRFLEAVDKFRQQWLNRQLFRGWFDAFVPIISTNNGLERLNLEIKCNYTFRERLPLPVFLNEVDLMLNDWSSNIISVPPSTSPTIANGDYQAAYNFWNLKPKYMAINGSYIIQSSTNANSEIDEDNFNELVGFEAADGWEKYVELRSQFYVVQPSTFYCGFYKCSCFSGLKDNVCKHALSLMCKDGLFDYPVEVTDVPLGAKRKRGRKRKATSALVID